MAQRAARLRLAGAGRARQLVSARRRRAGAGRFCQRRAGRQGCAAAARGADGVHPAQLSGRRGRAMVFPERAAARVCRARGHALGLARGGRWLCERARRAAGRGARGVHRRAGPRLHAHRPGLWPGAHAGRGAGRRRRGSRPLATAAGGKKAADTAAFFVGEAARLTWRDRPCTGWPRAARRRWRSRRRAGAWRPCR